MRQKESTKPPQNFFQIPFQHLCICSQCPIQHSLQTSAENSKLVRPVCIKSSASKAQTTEISPSLLKGFLIIHTSFFAFLQYRRRFALIALTNSLKTSSTKKAPLPQLSLNHMISLITSSRILDSFS